MKFKCIVLSALSTLPFIYLTPALAQSSASNHNIVELPMFSDNSQAIPFYRNSLALGGDGISGAAWFDYDNDGDDDVFLPNGVGGANGLYENLGDGSFIDVTLAAGVLGGEGGAGVLAADFDNDGDQDLLVLGDGNIMNPYGNTPIALYRNNGDKTFTDVFAQSGISMDSHLTASAADIDDDGDLDIFISAPGNLMLQRQDHSKLYLNDGNLTFTDITDVAGITDTGLGACVSAFSDYDKDGDVDLFVGNCNEIQFLPVPMQLYRNDGDAQFTDVSIESGLSNVLGYWMSATFGDFNNDGWIDLYSSNLGKYDRNTGGPAPTLPAFLINHHGVFKNYAVEAQLSDFEFGWGASAADFNNDGWLDLMVVGNVPQLGYIGAIGNPGHLFINSQERYPPRFINAEDEFPLNLQDHYASGIATSDYDGDGDIDVIINSDSGLVPGQAFVLENEHGGNWLKLKLKGTISNKDAIGARATIFRKQLMAQVREIYAGSAFGASDSKVIHFGLGDSKKAIWIRIDWPTGGKEWFKTTEVNTTLTLVEGEGWGL